MDAEAFAVDALPLYDSLVRAVSAYCGDEALAQDSAQEALVRAWERVDGGESFRSLEAWTMTVAFNWCRSELRRGAARRSPTRSGALPDGPLAGEGDDSGSRSTLVSLEIRDLLLELPDRQRQVLVLHYLLGMDVAGISAVAGISIGAVKNALFNGRRVMRSLVLEDENDRGGT